MSKSTHVRRAATSVCALVLGAGALVFGADVAAGAQSVGGEAALRTAFGNAAETDITLTADITLTDCGAGVVTRSSATALTLHGAGHTVTQTCAGEGVFAQSSSGALTFESVMITGGTSSQIGGGVRAPDADVTLTDAALSHNSTSHVSGGGGLYAENVQVLNSIVSDNHAPNANGGGMETEGGVTVTSSSIVGNSAGKSGGGFLSFDGDTTITNSTIADNTATADNGGGLEVGGLLRVTNSTVSNNVAGDFGGGLLSRGGVVLVYVTAVENSALEGANVAADDEAGITSFGAVVAQPLGGGENCSTPASTSNGYNFSDDESCGFTGIGDRENAGNPLLGALADNGGTMLTRAPQTGSPLIDAIPAASCQSDGAAGITTDQIGTPRPTGTGCEIGALELPGPVAPPAPDTPVPAPVAAAPKFTG
jgi:hypothetical protein